MGTLVLGVLASGRGSNFQALIDEINSGRLEASIGLLVTDNPDAYAIERAKKHSIRYIYINRRAYNSINDFFLEITQELKKRNVEFVVLAGFMRIVGKPLINAFPDRIINIHPALLPSFPGLHAQRQALEHGVRFSGCTVHFVDEGVDTGPIIIQGATPVFPDDTEDALSERILKIEHKILPEAVRLYAEGRIKITGRVVRIEGHKTEERIIVNPAV